MKLKKGSAAAKAFMAKLRAAKKTGKKYAAKAAKNIKAAKKHAATAQRKYKAVKQALLSGEKHQDINSHNYRIKIGAAGDYARYEIATIKALAKLLKKPIKAVQKAVNEDKASLDIISTCFDAGKTAAQAAKLLKEHILPKKQVGPLEAFVNLLSSKGKKPTGSKSPANFPMKLPATVTIGNLQKDNLQRIQELQHKIQNCEALIEHTKKMIFGLHAPMKSPADRKAGKKTIATAKKWIANYKKQITQLKKLI